MPDASPPETPDTRPTSAASPALLSAVRRLLGPLVRLLLEHQITFPVLANLLKSVYVEEAERHFSLPDRPQTISRINLLTGIHRKDVKRLRTEAADEGPNPTPTAVSLGAQLVLRWTAEPEYLTDGGRPRALPRLAGTDDGPSFDSLVGSFTQDIRPRAVLDEWLRLGIAILDADDRVHLVEEAFIPAHGFDEKVHFLGRNVRDHLAAVRHNLAGEGGPFLERSVYYAGLRPESVEELQSLAREAGMDALQRVNRRARVLQHSDEDASDAHERMSFGAWFFRDRLATSDDTKESDPDEGGSDAA